MNTATSTARTHRNAAKLSPRGGGAAESRLYRQHASTRLDPLLKAVGQGAGDDEGTDPVRDATLWLQAIAQRQDRAAFARLFVAYGPRLKGHLLARGADGATAEELVQDIMLTVWRKAEQFDVTRGSPGAWMFTLARNAFVDRVRHEHRPHLAASDPLLHDSAAHAPDRLFVDAEDRRALTAAVDSLPAEQRHILARSYFHGQSLAQISAAEGLPLGTVKTRARLALSRLRALVSFRKEP